jgi:acetyl esterase/lipase
MGKKLFFVLAMALLAFICIIDHAVAGADDTPDANYERYYPKYVDSKEPLNIIKINDINELRKSSQEMEFQSIPAPITMSYGSLAIQQLNIYRLPGKERKPLIFFIHAGAGDKSDVRKAIPAWLSLGYTVVSINHRAVPDNSFPEMVEDVNTALKWVMSHIQNYGGDPDRIAVTGISCGGHLSALLVTDKASQKKYGIDISRVKCWFPMSGFYDMDLKENLISPTIAKYIEWICVPSKKAASPAALATGKEPPCLIIHGGDDWCVPKTNAISFYNRLNKETTTLAILKGYMHANVFYSYIYPDHEPAKLIKNFLATYLPTEQNPKPEKWKKK